MDPDVVIVGGGHNGLVAATYLARAGLAVHVLERREFVGGACLTQELWPGFRFSMCALMTHAMPPVIFKEMGLFELGLQLIPLGGQDAPTADEDLYAAAGPISLSDGTYYGPAGFESPRNRSAASKVTRQEIISH